MTMTMTMRRVQGGNLTVKVWEAESGRLATVLHVDHAVNALLVFHDQASGHDRIVTAGGRPAVTVWDWDGEAAHILVVLEGPFFARTQLACYETSAAECRLITTPVRPRAAEDARRMTWCCIQKLRLEGNERYSFLYTPPDDDR
jgi:hypothetical protein